MNEKLVEKLLEVALDGEARANVDHPFKEGESYFIRTVTYSWP